MSAEARHEFNAKRAHSLKMARMRDVCNNLKNINKCFLGRIMSFG